MLSVLLILGYLQDEYNHEWNCGNEDGEDCDYALISHMILRASLFGVGPFFIFGKNRRAIIFISKILEKNDFRIRFVLFFAIDYPRNDF